MSLQSTNQEYDIVTNAEVSYIIAHFSDEMILDILEKNISHEYENFKKNNLVCALEEDFKKCFDLYPDMGIELTEKRTHIYQLIVNRICQYNGILCEDPANADELFSQAYFLYSFLVSDFSTIVINFFTNYIIAEKNTLYELMENYLSSRNKDFNTAYSKRIYKGGNNKLIELHANLNIVIDNICAFDIDFFTFSRYAFSTNPQLYNYLNLMITESCGELFRTQVVPFVMQNKPNILTMIKLSLQDYAELNSASIVKNN